MADRVDQIGSGGPSGNVEQKASTPLQSPENKEKQEELQRLQAEQKNLQGQIATDATTAEPATNPQTEGAEIAAMGPMEALGAAIGKLIEFIRNLKGTFGSFQESLPEAKTEDETEIVEAKSETDAKTETKEKVYGKSLPDNFRMNNDSIAKSDQFETADQYLAVYEKTGITHFFNFDVGSAKYEKAKIAQAEAKAKNPKLQFINTGLNEANFYSKAPGLVDQISDLTARGIKVCSNCHHGAHRGPGVATLAAIKSGQTKDLQEAMNMVGAKKESYNYGNYKYSIFRDIIQIALRYGATVSDNLLTFAGLDPNTNYKNYTRRLSSKTK